MFCTGVSYCSSLVGCCLRGLATASRYLTMWAMVMMMMMVKDEIDAAAMMMLVMVTGAGQYPAAQCAMGLVPTGWTATAAIWVMAVSRYSVMQRSVWVTA